MNIQDRRRVLGPALAPLVYAVDAEELADAPVVDVPPPFLATGLAPTALGLCVYEQGSVLLTAMVHGPRPLRGSFVERAALLVAVRTLPNSNELLAGGLLAEEHRVLLFVETALRLSVLVDRYPKLAIDVHVYVVRLGSLVVELAAAAATAAGLALVDAGIECVDAVVGGYARDGVEVAVAYLVGRDETAGVWMEGTGGLSRETLQKAVQAAQAEATRSRAYVNSVV